MKKLTVLLSKKYRHLSMAAILDVFQTVNAHYKAAHGEPFFDITLVCLDDDCPATPVYDIYTPVLLKDAPISDLILIPAFQSDHVNVMENVAFIPYLQEQQRLGAEIASFCTGAFLLAASGLLDNKKATSHVMAIQDLAIKFPLVKVQPEAVVTDDDGIYTSGGATSTFHLLLHLIEKYCNRQVAINTAKLFAIDMDRYRQSYFANWAPSRRHQDELVTEAQNRMENRFKDRLTVEEVIHDLPVSRRNFIRRFKMATGITPIEYLQRIRIEAAKKLLEQRSENITGVMMHTGYEDAKAFRQVFRKIVGLSPKEYREKYAG
ncbi:helix-turn-helix domain-containing protein [Chitinophaga sp. SYP-B3965]|uniref:GlxA family transcriptional regulator n=1 Tax=Chitinophaga sp. SYP-B3965 TaxID=2663120 RepID=UPI001299A716|nr:helix-turn-helix domain-containing protein [Chitinophaga sp. SYP-B3965]MRG45881.1 helix-turn-helix domain-containing protein [Chitinophaga sp. SYP-B3965]